MISNNPSEQQVTERIKVIKQDISRVQVVKAAERLHAAIQRHHKIAGGREGIQIMSEMEISLLQARRAANPDLFIDPVVVDRLMATAIHYRNAIQQAEKYLPSFVREQVIL